MIDRVDLLIAVIGIVASVMGSSTALWMALSKKADKDDVRRLEDRLNAKIDGVEDRLGARTGAVEVGLGGLEARVDTGFTRLESKLDALILRLVPETPRPEN